MNFCSSCGAKVRLKIPDGDNRPRYVCTGCGMIHYQNPKVVTGCIAEHEGKILLCKRAIEPRYGMWTLPAGFLENGETIVEGAARETYEEATAKLANIKLFGIYSIFHIDQIYAMYYGDLVDGYASPGTESLETALVSEDDIPWDEIAFQVVSETLRKYFDDRRQGKIRTHYADIHKQDEKTFTVKYY